MAEDEFVKQKKLWFVSGSWTFRIYNLASRVLRYLDAIFSPSNNVNM